MSTTRTRKRRRRPSPRAALRSVLVRRRDELLAQLHGELAGSHRDMVGSGFNDIADRASDSLYSELAQGLAELASAGLHMIEKAIRKIDARTYGRCESCGHRISAARVRALPFAELCITCKREEELADEAQGG